MNEHIRKLKELIDEYEELEYELEMMVRNWDSDNPLEAALSDPSDQYVKESELNEKYNEIKNTLKEF